MGSANFLERIAALRALAAEKGASSALIGNAGHLYVVAVAPVLGTDAAGPSSGEVIIFSLLTDAELSSRPGVEGANVVLWPAKAQPLQTTLRGGPVPSAGTVVTRVLTGPDGAEAARLQVHHQDSHAEVARRAAIFFAAAVVLLGVGIGVMANRVES
jgi:hypothetical protein